MPEKLQTMPLRLTGRQLAALELVDRGATHAQVATILRIRHRQAASRLIARAKSAAEARRDEIVRVLENR